MRDINLWRRRRRRRYIILFRLYLSTSFIWSFSTADISLACFSCETLKMKACVSFCFRVCAPKKELWSQAFLVESVDPGDKIGGVTKAMHRKLRKYWCERCRAVFRKGSVDDFYRLKALITLEQVITLVVKKKKNLNEQSFDGEANWSGVLNFDRMQMSHWWVLWWACGVFSGMIEMTRHLHHVFDIISLE